jgi:transposase
MISLPTSASIFLYSQPTDMRKSFCGLSGIVRSELGREPNDGSLFLFINRRRDRLKALYWQADGMILFYKLLEGGTFERIEAGDRPAVKIDAAELSMLLSGIDIQSARRRKRFRRTGECGRG